MAVSAAEETKIEDARERAFLRLLRWTENGDVSEDTAYRARFGGHDPMTDADMQNYTPKSEPFRHKNRRGKVVTDPVTAAGAYQVTDRTWRRAKKALGLQDFTPASQDRIAQWLIENEGAMVNVRRGQLEEAFRRLNKTWSSLPGGQYAHHRQQDVVNKYEMLTS